MRVWVRMVQSSCPRLELCLLSLQRQGLPVQAMLLPLPGARVLEPGGVQLPLWVRVRRGKGGTAGARKQGSRDRGEGSLPKTVGERLGEDRSQGAGAILQVRREREDTRPQGAELVAAPAKGETRAAAIPRAGPLAGRGGDGTGHLGRHAGSKGASAGHATRAGCVRGRSLLLPTARAADG